MPAVKKRKKTVLLPGAIGDWTKYRPQIEETSRIKASSKTAGKFSEKEMLDIDLALLDIFEEFTKALQKSTGLPMSAVSCSAETDNYADILKTVNVPVVQFKVSSPETEPLFICFDMTLANALVNASVGGQPDPSPSKNLTEIEENILEACASSGADRLLGNLSAKAEVKYLNSPNLYFDQSMDESAVLVLGRSQINFGRYSGYMFLIAPMTTAQAMLARPKRAIPLRDINRVPPVIAEKIVMPVRSVLGTTMISAKELYELEKGDVIVLDSPINNLLQISIGKDLHIMGQPGIKDDRLCVQILKSGSGRVERIKLSPLDPEKKEGSVSDPEKEPEFPKEEV